MIALALILLAALLYATCGPGLQGIAPRREYKSGTGFCFWRWTRVDSEYILRLHVFKTPWCAVCLHWIRKPDAEPWLHDHPVSFLSIILRGGYAEKRWSPSKGEHIKLNSWFNFIHGSRADRHRIILTRANTLTLCFMGPKTRDWGFHMPEGWIMWKDYYARLRAGENMRNEPIIAALNRKMDEHYTLDRVAALAGAPIGTPKDEDTRPVDGDFAVSREDFYKNFTMDFGDEDPTEPRR